MLFWILAALTVFIIFALSLGKIISAPGHSGPETSHFNGKKFLNTSGSQAKSVTEVLKWIARRDQGPWAKNYETKVGPKPSSSSESLLITFVNHSTFLIQWNHLNILTDPIWSERCSPFSFVGPQRMRPPGIHFEDLPHIDAVLISHNHYDHLDIPTIRQIEAKWSPVFIVPLGVKAHLDQLGIQNAIELDWWNETNMGITVRSLPAQHFSGRGMFDRDRTLWAGYLLEHGGKKVYFAGDSGYGDLFKEIGKKVGPVDVALIPIGAYLPIWFMSPIHISPVEAVKVHQDVKSAVSVGMHFGTFPLADEGQGKAEEDLILALEAAGVKQGAFIIPEEGKAMRF
ncbi:MBL fold metallo-hydrolase [Marinoscillum luteum]|uniref:MBL fold metallo-hydrolase n=1 Tax=Marinoscillum luteum TaxID=861051 RepID=A0ABW7N8M2_9BACT